MPAMFQEVHARSQQYVTNVEDLIFGALSANTAILQIQAELMLD